MTVTSWDLVGAVSGRRPLADLGPVQPEATRVRATPGDARTRVTTTKSELKRAPAPADPRVAARTARSTTGMPGPPPTSPLCRVATVNRVVVRP